MSTTPPPLSRTKKLLAEGVRKNRRKIWEWHLEHARVAPPPLYCSIDLRDSGTKIAPVDSNLYPAGFNNICPEDQRNAPPDPNMEMVKLKQQELQQRAEQAEQEFAQKQKELELKQAEIQRKALETHQDMTMAWQKVEAEKEESAAKLQETVLRYEAEMQHMQNDYQMNHANNLVKLLTHKEPQPKAK